MITAKRLCAPGVGIVLAIAATLAEIGVATAVPIAERIAAPAGFDEVDATDLDGDGNVIVGFVTDDDGDERAFRWRPGSAFELLSTSIGRESRANGVSADGSRVVGEDNRQAIRWLANGAKRSVDGSGFTAVGVELSGDRLVGNDRVGPGGVLVRPFTEERGDDASGQANATLDPNSSSIASGISGGGRFIIANGLPPGPERALRFDTGARRVVDLGDLAGGTNFSRANAIDGDGNVIVGASTSGSGLEAFRWTPASGIVGLGDLAGGGFGSEANDVTPDGTVIVGYGFTASGKRAFVWDPDNGMQNLETLLTTNPNANLNLGGLPLLEASAVSHDGLVIAGETNRQDIFRVSLATDVEINGSPVSLLRTTVDQTLGAGDTLAGTGTFIADVTNGGTIAPGNSHGTIVIDGDLISTQDGILDLEVLSLTDFDLLDISGTAILDGLLNLIVDGAYAAAAQVGDAFTIINWADFSGSFATVTGTSLANGRVFDLDFGTTGLTLRVADATASGTPVPEPPTALLAGFAFALLLWGRTTARRASRSRP